VRKRNLVLNDFRAMWPPLLLSAVVVTWSAIAVRSCLFVLVLAAVGVAALPLVERVRVRRGIALALLIQVGVLVVGWVAALLVTAPFANWE
jgi:hypothetical protein